MNLYEQCEEIFARYPLAVKADGDGASSMVLAQPTDGGDKFFIITHVGGDSSPFFLLRRWRKKGSVRAEADGSSDDLGAFLSVLVLGVPVPRDGTVLGWCDGGAVTAIMPFYTNAAKEPSFTVMPRADIPLAQWPPFEPQIGDWLWEHLRAGRIADLTGALAATSGTVFWADTWDALGADACVVTQPVAVPGGMHLNPGIYAYHEMLADPARAAGLDEAVSRAGRTDLGTHLASLGA